RKIFLFIIVFLKMTNINKIKDKQKDVMEQYMFEHPNLAKFPCPNCGQGKETTKRLWEELSNRLNACDNIFKFSLRQNLT
ncbi:hypothetical protein DOY81_006268, partial [Sarcophaga bullata]